MQTQNSAYTVYVLYSVNDGRWNRTRNGFDVDVTAYVIGPGGRVYWNSYDEGLIPARVEAEEIDLEAEAKRVAADLGGVEAAEVKLNRDYVVNGPEWEIRPISEAEYGYLTCGLAELYAETLAFMRSRYEPGLADRRAMLAAMAAS